MWESGSGTRDSGGGGGRVGRAGGGGACRAAPGGAGRRAAGAADGVTGGTGLGRRGAIPCGTVLLPGTAGPLARALNARQAVSYGTSPGIPSPFPAWRGQAVPGRPAGAGHPGRGGGGAAGAGAPLLYRRLPPALSGRRGHSAAPGCAAGGAAGAAPLPGVRPAKRPRNRAVPGPSSSRKDFSAGC